MKLFTAVSCFAAAVLLCVRAHTAELAGTVLDAVTGDPVPDVSVLLVGSRISAFTAQDGTFLFKDIPAGRDSIVAGRIDYGTVREEVDIPGHVTLGIMPRSIELEPVVVTSRNPGDIPPHERTSASVNVIDNSDFSGREGTVEELLDREVGIDIRSLGGIGANSDISIRGSTAEQVEVYMDGIPLTAGGSGLNGLSFVPVSQVGRIEVYRGSSPGVFSSGAIGGVVTIDTIRPESDITLDASGSYGSFGSNHQTVNAHYSPGTFDFLLSAGRTASENDFRYLDNRGTTFDTSDDGWETRENSDFATENIMSRLEMDAGKSGSVMSKVSFSTTERGVSGLGRRPARHARLSSEGLLAHLRYETASWRTNLWVSRETRGFFDPEDEAGRRGRQDTRDEIRIAGMNAAGRRVTGRAINHALIEIKREEYQSSDAFDADIRPPSRRLSVAAGYESEIMLMGERLWLRPKVHYTGIRDRLQDTGIFHAHAPPEEIDVDRHSATVALGARYAAAPSAVVRLNAGVFPRIPEFNELFGDTGDIVGNTALSEEQGYNVDTGIHLTLGERAPLEIDAGVFYRYASDLIQRRSYGDYLIAENIGKAQIAGVEAWAEKELLSGALSLRLSGAFQDARNRSDETVFRKNRYYGRLLPYHPRWKGALTADAGIPLGITLTWKSDHESECYKGPSNLAEEKLEARTIHSLSIARSFGNVETLLEAVNLGGNHAPDRWGYPKPGRGYYLTLSWRFEMNLRERLSTKTDLPAP